MTGASNGLDRAEICGAAKEIPLRDEVGKALSTIHFNGRTNAPVSRAAIECQQQRRGELFVPFSDLE